MGLKPDEFWKLTQAELLVMAEGYTKKKKQQAKEMIYLAWHVAALNRAKELPSLDSLLRDSEPEKPQTDEQMMAMCKLMNAALGGKVVETHGD